MRFTTTLVIALMSAPAASATTIAEFHEKHKSKIVSISKHSDINIQIEYSKTTTQAEQDAIEAEKQLTDFSDKPDMVKKEIDDAVNAKATSATTTDAEYGKLLRIQKMPAGAKRDTEWAALKPDLDR